MNHEIIKKLIITQDYVIMQKNEIRSQRSHI